MDDVLERELDEAEARGRELLAATPTARTASYDRANRRVVLELTDGRAYAFPPRLSEDLRGADEAALGEVVVEGAGLNLHWPKLDVDLFVPALIAGVFGTERWMAREFARHAGARTSPAKAAASRANGAKGGRPKRK